MFEQETQTIGGGLIAESSSEVTDTVTLCKRFVDLSKIKKAADDALESVKSELAILEAIIQERFINDGIGKMTVDGKTVYIHTQLWAGAAPDTSGEVTEASRARAIEALNEAGLGGMVYETFNTNTLSAHIRTLPADGEGMPILPPELDGAIKITKKYSIRAIKAGK